MLVATGIFGSRVVGLIRSRIIAHYFGLGAVADAVTAAFRIPNVLQNLFGDQALSASFIPVYSSLLAKGDAREADRVAGAVACDRARGAVGSVDAPVPAGPVVGGAAVGDGVTRRTTAGGAPPAGARASHGSIAPTTAR